MPRLSKRTALIGVALAVSAVVGAVAAKVNASGHLLVGAASTQVLVDFPDASIVERRALPQDVATLQKRAELYARLLTTPPVLEAVGRRAGVSGAQISGLARVTAGVPIPLTEPGSEERASQIRDSHTPYRLELQSDPVQPLLAIYAVAPSAAEAQRLADSAVLGLRDYLQVVARRQGFDQGALPRLTQLGSARGGVTNARAAIVIGGLTFITAFALTFAGLVLALRRLVGHDDARARRVANPMSARAAADWPRTTRLLPWTVAGFIVMLWLSPFDKIQLAVPSPIDLSLDRLILPVVAAVWLTAFAAGPGAAPHLRFTRVHAALAAFLACAFLSVVIDARYLNQTGELMMAVKRLPLLASYCSVFVIVASSVRRTEVAAFMKLTSVLAVLCGLGVLYEYRVGTNLFNMLWDKLLPDPFELALEGDGTGVDSLGRRWIVGPAAFGVELVTMVSMVLPLAILGVLTSKSRLRKVLHAIAIAVLVAAMFATQRKSALLAPGAVVLTLAYFRRRELLSLAPLGLVLAFAIAAISPDVIRGVTSQFLRQDRSSVATVSDRTADYDAIRPDVWSHLLFGRGYGSYATQTYRILDSEILSRTIETGVLGLFAFLLIAVAIVSAARRTASERDPRWAPAALWGVASAVCFVTVSTLYDVMAYPHAPMTLLYIAGLVVVAVSPDRPEREPGRAARGHAPPERVDDLDLRIGEDLTPVHSNVMQVPLSAGR